jgi:hypothetical protein
LRVIITLLLCSLLSSWILKMAKTLYICGRLCSKGKRDYKWILHFN